jgi:hypothetical protein
MKIDFLVGVNIFSIQGIRIKIKKLILVSIPQVIPYFGINYRTPVIATNLNHTKYHVAFIGKFLTNIWKAMW